MRKAAAILVLLHLIGLSAHASNRNHMGEFEFPKPSGPFTIGYKNIELEDAQRDDSYNPGHNRRLKVTVWYPSQDPLKLESYGSDEMEISELDKERIINSVPQDQHDAIFQGIKQFGSLKIYRFKNATPACGKFPIIVFSPGYMAKAMSYQRLFQELVSHGYVMMAIHHPYLTDSVMFESGIMLRVDDRPDEIALCTYTNDLAFVLASLPEITDRLDLHPTIDEGSIGTMGHSLGGEAIMRSAHNPSFNIQAAACLDSTTLPEGVRRQNREPSGGHLGFDIPFMYIHGGSCPLKGTTLDSLKRAQRQHDFICCRKDNFKVLMKEATHTCFGDYPFLQHSFPSLAIEEGFGYPENYIEDNYRNATMMVRLFFDRFLKNKTGIDIMSLSDDSITIETWEDLSK